MSNLESIQQNKDEIIKRNNIRIVGEGEKTILLAHGFGCDQNMGRNKTVLFERSVLNNAS